MANSFLNSTQHLLYCLCLLLTVLIIFLPSPHVVNAQSSNQHLSALESDVDMLVTTTTTLSTQFDYNDENVDENEIENVGDDEIYDQEETKYEEPTIDSSGKHALSFNDTQAFDLSKEEEFDDDDNSDMNQYSEDGDDAKTRVVTGILSTYRPTSKQPIIDSYTKSDLNSPSSTSRLPFVSSHILDMLFSRPAIFVSIVGGVCIGMVLAILFIMFIIYRMRKKDEGSYALEEAPRKSPSHAYSRVSSKEFYA